MLRRVARWVRRFVGLLGVLVVLWFFLSWFVHAFVISNRPWAVTNLGAARGYLYFAAYGASDTSGAWECYGRVTRITSPAREPARALLPSYDLVGESIALGALTVTIPLWLLAAVCLAWPVTSFVVARRRGRGFEVEATAGGAVSTPDS